MLANWIKIERVRGRFAIILEDEGSVLKWLNPPKDVLKIYYHQEEVYQPDFVMKSPHGIPLGRSATSKELTNAT